MLENNQPPLHVHEVLTRLHRGEQSLCGQIQGCLFRLAPDQASGHTEGVLNADRIQCAQA